MAKKKEYRWGDAQNSKNNQVCSIIAIQYATDMLNKELRGGE